MNLYSNLTLVHSPAETILIFHWFIFHNVILHQIILKQELHKMSKGNSVMVGN